MQKLKDQLRYIASLREDWRIIRDGINGKTDIESRYKFIKHEAGVLQYE